MLGLRYGKERLEPYNPAWVGAFAEERRGLLEALSGTACQVEHVGTTDVSELCAKPILDIAIGIAVGPPIEPIVGPKWGLGSDLPGVVSGVLCGSPTHAGVTPQNQTLSTVHAPTGGWRSVNYRRLQSCSWGA